MGPIILIAEDHDELRGHIREEIVRSFPGALCLETRTGREAVHLAVRHQPHIVLMDLVLPVLNGLEAMRRILKASPNSKVIVLSLHAHEILQTHARRAGAVAYIVKDQGLDTLVETVKRYLPSDA